MDDSLRAQIDSNLSHLDALIRRGRELRQALAAGPADQATLVSNRAWQQDIGVAINQLSGGSKAHWLARQFSEAFLLRSAGGRVVEAVEPVEIVERLIAVLDQAIASLARLGESQSTTGASVAAPVPHRFDFVHNTELRPVLEQAYTDSRDALEQGKYQEALRNACGILEAIVTDALEFQRRDALAASLDELPSGQIADWSFNERLAVAENARLIRGGCARLPDIARMYRDSGGAEGQLQPGVSEQEARRTTQVLHVVMRDLDPGR